MGSGSGLDDPDRIEIYTLPRHWFNGHEYVPIAILTLVLMRFVAFALDEEEEEEEAER